MRSGELQGRNTRFFNRWRRYQDRTALQSCGESHGQHGLRRQRCGRAAVQFHSLQDLLSREETVLSGKRGHLLLSHGSEQWRSALYLAVKSELIRSQGSRFLTYRGECNRERNRRMSVKLFLKPGFFGSLLHVISRANWLVASEERHQSLLRHLPRAYCTPLPCWQRRRLPREDDRSGRRTIACRSGSRQNSGTE
jgi:hypothetical protein